MDQNQSQPVYVLTGASSGMGLHVAAELAGLPDARIVVGVRSPDNVGTLRAAVPEHRLTVLKLDLVELQSVSDFADQVVDLLSPSDQLRSIICNAGLQMIGPKKLTAIGVERTFQVNVLGHFLLVELLSNYLEVGGSVVTVGSGTHNPDDKLAARFGFRGGFFPSARTVAIGDLGQVGSDMQLGMDRYATSKLCAVLYAQAMAQGDGTSVQATFYAFDPGLMPGTRLARERSLVEKMGWRYILPLTRFFLSDVSSSKKSGAALVERCVVERRHRSGSYIDVAGESAPRSAVADDKEKGEALVTHCRSLVSDYLP